MTRGRVAQAIGGVLPAIGTRSLILTKRGNLLGLDVVVPSLKGVVLRFPLFVAANSTPAVAPKQEWKVTWMDYWQTTTA